MKFIKCKIRNQDKFKWIAVSDEDYEELNRWSWFSDKDGYAVRASSDSNGRKLTAMPMHRQLMSPPKGMVVDHIDRSKTNNQRSNLRICTSEQNRYNTAPRNKLKLKGINQLRNGMYEVKVRHNGTLIHIGQFDSVAAAVYAYNHHATRLQGEYAYKNEITTSGN